jgi:gliding motility-associated-like protein
MSTNISLSSTVAGTTFAWTVNQSGLFGPSSGNGTTISQMLTTVGINSGTVTYTITPTFNGCSGNPITVTIVVNPTPEVFGSTMATICSGESPNISLFPSIAATTFSWTVATIGVTGAQSGTGNTINDILEADSNTGTAVYTVTPEANNCSGTPLNITVNVNPLPKPLIENGIICVDAITNISFKNYLLDTQLNPTDFDFVWYLNGVIMNGEVGATLDADVAGTYSVLVTNTVSGCVSKLTSAIVTSSTPGTSVSSMQTLAFSDDATIEVTVLGGTATYYYSLDEGAFQLSNIFTNVEPGTHSILVTDVNGCTNLPLSVNIVGYPTYFTPNGDGIHDTWNIIGLSSTDKVNIYDRYGKLIKQISARSNGWDGTFNGQNLTSSDYWFTIDYKEPSTGESKIFKSHFSLKR